MTGAAVFLIGSFSDLLREHFYPPADVRESLAKFFHFRRVGVEHIDFLVSWFGGNVGIVFSLRTQTPPAVCNFPIGPTANQVRTTAQDEVTVIRQHCVGQQVNREDRAEKLHSLA